TKGTVSITNTANGAFTFTPSLHMTGSDSFTFKLNDGQTDSNNATVSITITGSNAAPVASAASFSTPQDTPYSGSLSASDADNDSLRYSIVTNPAKGSVIITDVATGAFTYTPAFQKSGSDSFTFKASDGQSNSNTATMSITITEVNVAPVAGDQSFTTLQ